MLLFDLVMTAVYTVTALTQLPLLAQSESELLAFFEFREAICPKITEVTVPRSDEPSALTAGSQSPHGHATCLLPLHI